MVEAWTHVQWVSHALRERLAIVEHFTSLLSLLMRMRKIANIFLLLYLVNIKHALLWFLNQILAFSYYRILFIYSLSWHCLRWVRYIHLLNFVIEFIFIVSDRSFAATSLLNSSCSLLLHLLIFNWVYPYTYRHLWLFVLLLCAQTEESVFESLFVPANSAQDVCGFDAFHSEHLQIILLLWRKPLSWPRFSWTSKLVCVLMLVVRPEGEVRFADYFLLETGVIGSAEHRRLHLRRLPSTDRRLAVINYTTWMAVKMFTALYIDWREYLISCRNQLIFWICWIINAEEILLLWLGYREALGVHYVMLDWQGLVSDFEIALVLHLR